MPTRYGFALTLTAVLLGFGPSAHAQPQSRGMDMFNKDLQTSWTTLYPDMVARVRAEARSNLNGLEQQLGPFDVKIRRVTKVTFQAPLAPALKSLSRDALSFRLPRRGTMRLAIQIVLRVKLKRAFLRPSFVIPLTLEVRDLSVGANLKLDTSDPTRPKIKRAGKPVVTMRLRIRSKNKIANRIVRWLTKILNPIARSALDEMLSSTVVPALNDFPGPVWADNTPPLADSGVATPFEEVAKNIDRKIRAHHTPHGTLVGARMSIPVQEESWLTAYGPGGGGNAGVPTSYNGTGDSAIWTGHYLASQALRYGTTADSEALDNVRWLVRGFTALLGVNGDTGLLARVAAPLNSSLGAEIKRRGVFGRAQLYGETWVGRQGSNGVSRDQYAGAFLGLTRAWELVGPADAAIKAECERLIVMMLDYLVGGGWIIDEDRPAFRRAGGGTPTIWSGIAYQQMTLLNIGKRVAPGRYDAELQRLDPLSDVAWLGAFLTARTLDGYYKFNLQMINYYHLFQYETDPQRWKELSYAYRITERWIGAHQNPHFDLIRASIDPSLRTLHPQVREVLRQFLNRNHREKAPPVVDLSGVNWIKHTFYGPGGGSVERVPDKPLDVVLRKYTGNFQWQKQPSRPAKPGDGSARLEKHGTDYALPYWMGRAAGAF